MSFQSKLYQREIVIDDSNFRPVVEVDPNIYGRGLFPREEPHGSLGFAAALSIPLIPESEWPDRIEEMERRETRLSDLARKAQLPCKNQGSTNYCWINAPVHCVEVVRVVQGEPMVILSPASCGSKIKNFRNVGGWGTEGLRYIVEHGIVPVDLWPANAIGRRYDTAEAWERAEDFRVTEWWDIRPRNLQELFSVLFARIPVAVGYNWWGHEVTAYDPVLLGRGKYGLRIRNSWGMDWGDAGFSVLTGSRMLPDDACAPRTAIPAA